jgi:crotonobetainyl-CoA:carnitine CoA-transferase CaiB-like acyl-CoA transferase
MPLLLIAVPVRYDGEPAKLQRAPELEEHGERMLAGLGLDDEVIVDVKLRGVVTRPGTPFERTMT